MWVGNRERALKTRALKVWFRPLWRIFTEVALPRGLRLGEYRCVGGSKSMFKDVAAAIRQSVACMRRARFWLGQNTKEIAEAVKAD